MGGTNIDCSATMSQTVVNKNITSNKRIAGSISYVPTKKIKVEKKYEIGFYAGFVCSECCKLAENDYDPKRYCSNCNGSLKKVENQNVLKPRFFLRVNGMQSKMNRLLYCLPSKHLYSF
jgi:hypothetical protein